MNLYLAYTSPNMLVMTRTNRGDHARGPRQVTAPANLPYQMLLLTQAMGRQFQSVLREYKITPLHWGVLCCLWEEDGQALQDIAERLEQLPGTLTVGVAGMQRRGLVTRTRDAADGRVWRIALTQRGRAMEKKLLADVAALLEDMFGSLSEREYRNLERSVERLRADLSGREVQRVIKRARKVNSSTARTMR